jgi:uncharacterized membrane protein YeiB
MDFFYRGWGLLASLIVVIIDKLKSNKKANIREMMGAAALGRVILDSIVFAIYYSTGSFILGAKLEDLEDSLIIIVIVAVYLIWDKMEKRAVSKKS